MDSHPGTLVVLRPPASNTSAPLYNKKKLAIFISLTHFFFSLLISNSIQQRARTKQTNEDTLRYFSRRGEYITRTRTRTHSPSELGIISTPNNCVCMCVCAQDNESSHGRSEKYKESTSNDMLYSVVLFSVRRTNIGFPLCASVVCVQYYYFCFLFFYITSLRFILIVFIYICVVCTSHLFRLPLELTDFFSPSNCMGTNSLTHQTH